MLHLEEYTKRSLTYDSDAINAFQGILSRFTAHEFWGILIFASSDSAQATTGNEAFLLGLLWSRNRNDSGGALVDVDINFLLGFGRA